MASGPLKRGPGFTRRPMADINVTPLVDVMLVLLVIFMVTAPLLTAGVPVDLPKSTAQALRDPVEPLVISIDAQGQIFIQETPIDGDDLERQLAALAEKGPQTHIYVRGDRTINYGRVMEVMGRVSSAGYERVALVTQPQPKRTLPRK